MIYFQNGKQLQPFPSASETLRDLRVKLKDGSEWTWDLAMIQPQEAGEYDVIDRTGLTDVRRIRAADIQSATAELAAFVPIGRPDNSALEFARARLAEAAAEMEITVQEAEDRGLLTPPSATDQ